MALFPVLSAMRCAGRRQLSTFTTAGLSALHGGVRTPPTAALFALHGGVRHAWTFAPSETRSEVFRIERYSEIKRKLGVGQKIRWDPYLVGSKFWRVLCYPNGPNDKYAGSLSLFLEYDDCRGSTAAEFRVSIIPEETSKQHTYIKALEEFRFWHQGHVWGWIDFITHQELEEHLEDDCLTFRCDVTVTDPCFI